MKINQAATPDWTLRELEVFLVLAQTCSFRRTAEQVHLSQSAVSGVIARLEDGLGARLFDRTTRSVTLTQAGEVFVEQAGLLQAQADEAARRVRSITQLQAGQVRIAAMPSLAATVVPRAMARFAAAHPGVQLSLIDVLSGPAFDVVRAGQADFALTAADPAYTDLDYTPLTADGFVLLCPAGHRLGRSERPLRWQQVAQEVHVSMPLPASVRQYANAAFLQLGITFAPRYEVEHIATIHALVRAGLGVAALPELAADFVRQEGVVRRRLTTPDIQRPIGVATRRNRSLPPACEEMIRLLRQETSYLLG